MIRTKSDYENFFVISIPETREQVAMAREIVSTVLEYVGGIVEQNGKENI
ncbi:MAG: hypothetical protein IJ679_03690 [Lachnospiraceae bacterium]|nr:hypothetical protein [Lachnospiraceae bacterium]